MNMDGLFEFGLGVTYWLQTNLSALDGVLSWVSAFGSFEIYLAIVLFIFWCLDKAKGKHLAYLLIMGGTVVICFKHLLRQPRPFWLDPAISLGEWGGGYGAPSGHTFLAVVTFVFLSIWISQRRWVIVTSVVMIVLTIVSRLYLGDHFPHDTAAGAIIALLFIAGYWVWMEFYEETFAQRILGQRFWLSVAIPLGLISIYGLGLFLLGTPSFEPEWQEFGTAAEIFSYEDGAFAFAVWSGVVIGFVFEGSRVRFLADGPWGMRIGRYVLGMGLVFAVLTGLRALFGLIWSVDQGLGLFLLLRFVRYYFVVMTGMYYAPALFVLLGLADADPVPKISGSLNKLKRTALKD